MRQRSFTRGAGSVRARDLHVRARCAIVLIFLLGFAVPGAASGRDSRSDAVRLAVAEHPDGRIAIEVVLREPDRDAQDIERWAEIAERRADVLQVLPADEFTLRRRYRTLSGFAAWASPAASTT